VYVCLCSRSTMWHCVRVYMLCGSQWVQFVTVWSEGMKVKEGDV